MLILSETEYLEVVNSMTRVRDFIALEQDFLFETRTGESRETKTEWGKLGEVQFPRLEYLYIKRSSSSRALGRGSCNSDWIMGGKCIEDGSEFKTKLTEKEKLPN